MDDYTATEFTGEVRLIAFAPNVDTVWVHILPSLGTPEVVHRLCQRTEITCNHSGRHSARELVGWLTSTANPGSRIMVKVTALVPDVCKTVEPGWIERAEFRRM